MPRILHIAYGDLRSDDGSIHSRVNQRLGVLVVLDVGGLVGRIHIDMLPAEFVADRVVERYALVIVVVLVESYMLLSGMPSTEQHLRQNHTVAFVVRLDLEEVLHSLFVSPNGEQTAQVHSRQFAITRDQVV